MNDLEKRRALLAELERSAAKMYDEGGTGTCLRCKRIRNLFVYQIKSGEKFMITLKATAQECMAELSRMRRLHTFVRVCREHGYGMVGRSKVTQDGANEWTVAFTEYDHTYRHIMVAREAYKVRYHSGELTVSKLAEDLLCVVCLLKTIKEHMDASISTEPEQAREPVLSVQGVLASMESMT